MPKPVYDHLRRTGWPFEPATRVDARDFGVRVALFITTVLPMRSVGEQVGFADSPIYAIGRRGIAVVQPPGRLPLLPRTLVGPANCKQIRDAIDGDSSVVLPRWMPWSGQTRMFR